MCFIILLAVKEGSTELLDTDPVDRGTGTVFDL